MKKAEKLITYVLILFAGIAVGMMTPQSWYPTPTVLVPHANVRAMLGR
ncbi:MAG TPA: hypothetical protein VME18_10225 [Acidobacteriaceae bacterium]|jgi:hypothetical protein|nr:hypothetical protein [Acidobacteriaceae bacterium]